MKLPDWRYEQIKMEVAKIFVKCSLNQIPITGFEIANKLGIIVIPYSAFEEEKRLELIEEDEDGFYIKKDGKYYIYYNNTKDYGRINFTILHEIGHIALDHTKHSELAESEANFFAKYAIAPPVLVDKFRNGASYWELLVSIYENFRVTRTAGYNCFKYYLQWKAYFSSANEEYKDYEKMILEQFN